MKKEGWPHFPYSHWDSVKKWNMSSLQLIALRLEEKGSSSRTQSGYRGDTSDMEKQIINHISDLGQRTAELEDAVQALLQIIDDNRPSVRARRVGIWIAERIRRCKQSLQESTTYWILGFLGVLITVYAVAKYVFHYLVVK
jgi:hypothetical protein